MTTIMAKGKGRRMRIFTSSWRTDLPPTIQRIGISRGTPRGEKAGYRLMKELAPQFNGWNACNPSSYHTRYMAQLADLDPKAILAKITDLGASRDVALLCFEKPSDPAAWCHRGQFAAWAADTLGIEVFEFGLESQGAGWAHPKLLPEFRK